MWSSFVAIGDSFTEGMMDSCGPDGRHRGWADRTADHLSTQVSDFRYANLAVRGKLLNQIAREQVPVAEGMHADLVSVAGGINDAMRRSFDVNGSASYLESAVRTLRGSGSDVVMFAFGDPNRRSAVTGTLRHRLWQLNSATRDIARVYDCFLVDFWGLAVFDDDVLWDEDRLHLSPDGHRLVTSAVLETLSLGDERWRTPKRRPVTSLPRRTAANAKWLGLHGLPWAARRLQGRSSGDGLAAKRPVLTELSTKNPPMD
jgi:lysophospholipase L1-like esterase